MSYICVRFRRISRDSVLTFRPIRRAISFLTVLKTANHDLSGASQSFAAAAAKESPIIFSGDMCGGENTSRPANVRTVRQRRTVRALQSGRKPICQKVILFDSFKNSEARSCFAVFVGVKFCAPALRSARRRAPSADTAAGAGRAAAPSGQTGRAHPAETAG